jgi:hypothetical protein
MVIDGTSPQWFAAKRCGMRLKPITSDSKQKYEKAKLGVYGMRNVVF